MAINLQTSVILKNTCILRGSSHNDEVSKKRWFSYYGEKKDINKFCKNKDFVERYAINGYQYYMVLKPIHLVTFPYISLEVFEEQDVLVAANLAITLVKYVQSHPDSPVMNRFGVNRVFTDILNILIPDIDELEEANVSPDLVKELSSLKEMANPGKWNPDHSVAALVCELGFDGWLRMGRLAGYTAGDEIFVCNINDLENSGRLEQREECNLGNCP